MAISAVVNTLNEEKHIKECLESLRWANEIVVLDGGSTDQTCAIAKQFTDKIFSHADNSGYVETARNAAIEKATSDWVLIVDADEQVPTTLAAKLKEVASRQSPATFYQIPRRNIIFGKAFEHTGWWPDYHIRFFKKGSVTWTDQIHVPPQTTGQGDKLPAEEQYALIHQHYESVSQYLARLDRYTTIQAKNLVTRGYTFSWPDLLRKPMSEFLTRFFVWEGYKDGLHGLILSLLQAFSFVIVFVKVWEVRGFTQESVSLHEIEREVRFANKELGHWLDKQNVPKNRLVKLAKKLSPLKS